MWYSAWALSALVTSQFARFFFEQSCGQVEGGRVGGAVKRRAAAAVSVVGDDQVRGGVVAVAAAMVVASG